MDDEQHAADLRAERIGLIAGSTLALVVLGALVIVALEDGALARGLATQVATHALIGRETGIPTGLALGNPPVAVALVAAAQDLVVLGVGYALVMLAARGSLRVTFLSRLAHRPHERRDKFAKRTEAVGALILAGALWIPFLPSGALVAALLARAAGYRSRVFLPIIAVNAAFATLAYTAFAYEVGRRIGPIPYVIAAAVIAASAGLIVWMRSRRKAAR